TCLLGPSGNQTSAPDVRHGRSLAMTRNGGSMAGILDDIHPALRPLWDLENELRSAAQNAIFLRNDEAKKHMDEARRHYQEALKAIKGEATTKASDETNLPAPPSSTRRELLIARSSTLQYS